MYLMLENINVSYGNKAILKNLNLQVQKGEIMCLLGGSGEGKTTILNVIGGFVQPQSGKVILDGQDITNVPVEKRHISTVFQSYCLFPHMNVYDNVAYGLKIAHKSKEEIKSKVDEYLNIVELLDYKKRRIYELSGGQQQRVALARSLIVEPSLCLLDEPFCNLDAMLRVKMRETLKNIQKRLSTTMVFVTHDAEEALYLSNSISIIEDGKIVGTYGRDKIMRKDIDEYSYSYLSLDDYEWEGDYLYKKMRIN